MRKIIIILVLVIGFLSHASSVVDAGSCMSSQCAAWDCKFTCTKFRGCFSACKCTDYLIAGGDQSQCGTKYCGPGTYVCNRPGGCCDFGPVSTPAPEPEPDPPAPPEPTAIPTPIPTSTPTPTPTPIPVGTITARAVRINAQDTSCGTIKAVPTTAGQVNGTTLQFTPSSASQPPSQTQSGANYVTFANILAGWYSVDPVPPTVDWMSARPCWTNLTNGATGEGLSNTLPANQTIQWDIGYTLGTAWLQTQGGDVYASGNLRSYIPNVTPRVFSRDGTGGYPGIVTYGTSYDLDSSPFSSGGTLVSSKNWQVHATQAVVDYYDYFYRRFGAPTVTDNDSFPSLLSVAKPASRATPYYIAGNMTTFGDWTVATGENIVFIVTGNVTIGGKINITGDGFVAFIVNGNIIVNSSVGVSALSTASVLDGMYIVSPTGTFQTGLSTAAATARFVGKGMFIAGNFLLERDLELVSGNTASSAELFIYDPQLLITLPDSMKDTSVSWQEVAP